MRVVSGTARGCKLQPVPGMNTRPTTDRVKENVFNLIQEHVRAARAVGNVRGQGHAAAGVLGDLPRRLDQFFRREQRFGRAGGEVHAHLGAGDHQRIGHVVARVAHEGELHAGKAAELFLNG